jgi:hypothetical protein
MHKSSPAPDLQDSVDGKVVGALPLISLTEIPPTSTPALRRSSRQIARSMPPPSTLTLISEGQRSHTDRKGKERATTRKRKRNNEDEAYISTQESTAHNIVQHVKDSPVEYTYYNADQTSLRHGRKLCSLMQLHAGNAELICIRRRETQTLYVTDFIEPQNCQNPRYGKLHVGIYIAAI